jgi:hypothetical protein
LHFRLKFTYKINIYSHAPDRSTTYDKYTNKDIHALSQKAINNTINNESKYQAQKDNKRTLHNTTTKNPQKESPINREDRLRDFYTRSQRKTNTKMLVGQNSGNFTNHDMATPKKSLGKAFDIMNLSNMLDQRNKVRHMNRNLELGNEPSDQNRSSSFGRYNQRSVERLPREAVHGYQMPPITPGNQRVKNTIIDVRRSVERDFTKDNFFSGKSNDFNLNNIKINPITGQLSPLQKKS